MKKYVPIILMILLGVSKFSFAGGTTSFEFDSGGANHPGGYGAWHISIDKNGDFSAENIKQQKTEKCAPVKLLPAENVAIWNMIDSMKPQKKVVNRPGIPDEVQKTFVYISKNSRKEYKVWGNDVNDDPRIASFIDNTAALIQKYCKKEPILK